MPITYLDGPRLKDSVIAGAQRLIQMQEQLNHINVFPVPDGDTGTNMALTMRSVAEGALNCKEQSVHAVSLALADSALMGARGNSGAILAQFFQGLSEGFSGKTRADLGMFAAAVKTAARLSREAIAEPREGTILTVIHDWAQHIHDTWQRVTDFPTLLRESLQAATESLHRTPEKLKVLAKAGVVDAGAQGFVHLLEGILQFVQSGKIERLARGILTFGNARARVEEQPEQITFQYCTQAYIVGQNIDRQALREQLRPLGDSMIVAGSSERVRIHIHSNEPEQVFAVARAYGELVNCRQDDMRSQHSRAHHDPAAQTVAVITDSACDLPGEDFIRYNIHMVPVALAFGSKTYIDKVTITDRDFYELLATSPVHPTTSQPAPGDFKQVYLQAAQYHREAVAIILTGALSGTLQAAQRAAQAVHQDINIRVIDSKNVCIAQGLIVKEAAIAAENGMMLADLEKRVQWAVQNVRLFFTVETMDYLVRGGRVSRWRGGLAGLLKIRPIITITPEGRPQMVARAFRRSQSHRKLIAIATQAAAGKRNLRVMVAHANAPEAAASLAGQLRRQLELAEVPITSVSPALGVHAGPGAVAIAVLGE
ncbi:MAG: DegV family EDD domain-containing protein [candidate division KSB1 bacterium]|nr:DegV family EDD domain-containing protein [candidate division KSB1 bacterium]MDZ7273016.1 DegV family EDD domain-containing protein [candidate division KSB1 bacterium]MDZ7285119.1 DegV family EDD domain-containing protein [candidate division KSB1 bacterium]MDZ7298151.1 DegV family EDD domain-containing protein [candidate division KSB1 bacterium]MDZ7306905.1 DegV family EDD domain-containing protein [candidate division KSB1 bacterium]